MAAVGMAALGLFLKPRVPPGSLMGCDFFKLDFVAVNPTTTLSLTPRQTPTQPDIQGPCRLLVQGPTALVLLRHANPQTGLKIIETVKLDQSKPLKFLGPDELGASVARSNTYCLTRAAPGNRLPMRGIRATAAVAVVSATVAYPRYASPRWQPCSIFTNRAPPRRKLQTRTTITDIHRLTVTSAATSEAQESKMQLPRHPMVVKCAYIAFCACFGTLARLYTDKIQPSNFALQGSFLSNSIGSFALGVLEASDLDEERLGGLYTGLTVGLCGSYTTFSGWKLRAGRIALGDAECNTDGIVVVVYIVESLAFFATCYIAGRDLVKTLAAQGLWHCSAREGGGSGGGGCRGTTARAALAGSGSLYAILAVLLYVDNNWTRRTYWMASMFAPLGALLRYYLSK